MNTSVSSSAWNAFGRLFWPVAIILALLLGLSWLMGYGGPGGSMCKAPAVAAAPAVAPVAAPVVAPAPAPAPAPVAAVAPAAPAVVAPPAVAAAVDAPPAAKVYFGLDKTGLPGTTNKTLADVVAYLKRNSGAKAVVSGYHDPTGNAEHNHWLAKTRAEKVGGALQALGVGADRIVLEKPSETTGSGTHPEARRVEVSVKP